MGFESEVDENQILKFVKSNVLELYFILKPLLKLIICLLLLAYITFFKFFIIVNPELLLHI